MLFRAKVPGTNANFAWLDSAGTERMRIDSAGDTSTSGKLTVQNVIRFGNYSGGNYDNIQFMRGTGSGQYPNIRCQENYIAMYVSDAGGWINGSQVGDMVIRLNTGLNLRFGVGSNAGLVDDSSNNVLISQRELRVSQMNGHGQIRLKSGSTNISTIFHCNGTELYFLCTNNGDWEGGYNGLRPLKYNLTSGLVTMDNGLTVNNTITVASGDNSMTYYGPNTTWSAYLAVGSGTDKSNGNTAQVISTNGNLHMDAGNGLDMYYGYYPWARSTPNVHRFYGNVLLPELSYAEGGYVYIYNGGRLGPGPVSDIRLKDDIVYITDTQTALTQVNNLKPATFKFKNMDGRDPYRVHFGYIAQDLEQHIPFAVNGKKYEYEWEMDEEYKPKFNENGDIIYKLDKNGDKIIRPRSIIDTPIIATQTLAIQELTKRATSQATLVQELAEQNAELTQKLNIVTACNARLLAWAQTQGFSD
jgi:hypothetical protein